MSVVLTEVSDRILTVTINRPEKLNALNPEVMEGLAAAFERARGDERRRRDPDRGRREGVHRGRRRHDVPRRSRPSRPARSRDKGQAVLDSVENLGKPVIAAVNGFALGGGCEVALACTLRVASKNARLGQPEVNLGIIPGYGGSQRLPRLVGKGRALEMLLTGRHGFGRRGVAHRPREPGRRACRAAAGVPGDPEEDPREGAGRDPLRPRRRERGPRDAVRRRRGPRGERFSALCFATEDMKEGVSAFLEKRPAKFTGR